MASWNIPALVNKISEDIPALKVLLSALAKWTDSGTENVPVGAKRLQAVTGGRQIQEYVGSPPSWQSVGKLIHDCDTVDGKSAATSVTANTIPVRDANGKVPGDILGNAATATTAAGLADGFIVPRAKGGTGAADAANARLNLGTNIATNITAGVLPVARGGTGSGTQNFVDLSTNQTVGGNKTFSGEVTLNRSVLKMAVLDTTTGSSTTRTDTVLQGISSNSAYGISAMFGASGNAVVGAGEGKSSLLSELAGNAGEDVYIIADGAIHFHPNANTYANRKSILLNASGELSGLAKVTAANFAGNLTGNVTGSCSGNAGTATKIYRAADSVSHVQGCQAGKALVSSTHTGYGAIWNAATKNTRVSMATYPSNNDLVYLISCTNADVASNKNTIHKSVTWNADTGELSATSFVGNVTGNCSGSSGSCTGNAKTATTATSAGSANTSTTRGTGDNSTNIATTAWVRTYCESTKKFLTSHQSLAGYAKTGAAQTFTAVTTFSKTMKSSAGDVLTGTSNGSMVRICAAPSVADGAHLVLWGRDAAGQPGTFNLTAQAGSGSTARILSGKSNGTLTWKGNTVQVSSDERLKTPLSSVPDKVLDAWEDVQWGQFKFLDARKEKGDKARFHLGLIAQRVKAAFDRRGLDACQYGILCLEKYDDGDLWMVRYQEAEAMENVCLRRRIDRLEKRLAALEKRDS